MIAEHFEFLVEEPSMEAFLSQLLPKILAKVATYRIYVHQGKLDLINKLNDRLRAYAKWLPDNMRVVVLLDRDDDDCVDLKTRIEQTAIAAGLRTRSTAGERSWQVVNRIAIEELEAWFFGEWSGVRLAYPKVSATVPAQAAFRAPDAVTGGTWEAFERILKSKGYFGGGLRKVEAATSIGAQFDPARCSSPSFNAFRQAIEDAITCSAIDGK